MLSHQEQGKRRYALVGVAALAVLLICMGALAAQRPHAESVDRHEQLARLDLEDDAAIPKPKPKPKPVRPVFSRKKKCKAAANAVAMQLSRMGMLCARLNKGPINKKRCLLAMKRTISFPYVYVIDEPKEFARRRKPVSLVFDCAEDLFKFIMGKKQKKVSVTWSFGPKPFRVIASACSRKGVSAFLRPQTTVAKLQGKKVTIVGKDMVFKVDTKRVRLGRRRRGLKVSKMVVLGIADISRRRGPKLGMDVDEDGYDFEEMGDEEELE